MADILSNSPKYSDKETLDTYMVIALIDEFRQIYLHSLYMLSPTREELIDLLCHRSLQKTTEYETNDLKYKYNDPISRAIRDGSIKALYFFKMTGSPTWIEEYLKTTLEKIKKELADQEIIARKLKRLKLYQELKKEFEGE